MFDNYDIYKPYAGLEGLKGLNYLREKYPEEINPIIDQIRQDYRGKYLYDTDVENIFNNRVFISTYGIEAFEAEKDINKRKAYHRNQVINTEWDTRFKDSEGNYPSEVSGIYDPEAKLHILETPMSEINIAGEAVKGTSEIMKEHGMYGMGNFVADLFAGNFNKERHVLEVVDEAKAIQMKNAEIQAAPVTNLILDNIKAEGENNPDKMREFEAQFDELMNASEGGFNIFYNYKAFEDRVQLENFTYDKKMEMYALWNALQLNIPEDASEEVKAAMTAENIEIINNKFKDIINEETPVGDVIWDTIKGAGTKATSTFLGLGADLAFTIYSMTGNTDIVKYLEIMGTRDPIEKAKLSLMSEEEYAQKLLDDIHYWANVDKYGSFLTDVHNLADANGGVSPHKYMRAAGEEYDIWNVGTLVDVGEMTGYVLGSLATDYALGGLGKLVSNPAAKALTKGAVSTTKTTGAAAKITDKTLKAAGFADDVIRMTAHTVPEASLEAITVYDEVYNYGLQQLKDNAQFHNQKIDELARKKYDEVYGAYQEQVFDPEHLHLETPGFRYTTPEYKAIREEIANEYLADQKEQIENAALKAYNAEFTIKGVANALIDGTFKKYMFSKDLTYGRHKSLIDEDLIKETAGGTFAKKQGKELISPITKKFGKLVVGGGLEEVSDELWNKGAVAVGYNTIDNYNTAMYKPEAEAYINGFASDFYAWNTAALGSLTDPATWYQGVVGALSPFGTTLNPIGGAIGLADKSKTGFQKGLSFIVNPILSEYMSLDSQLHNIDVVLNGKDGSSGLNAIIERQKPYLENAASSVAVMDNQTVNSDNIATQWKTRFNTALKFVSDISSLGALGQSSSLYNTYIEDLNRLAEGNITQQDGASYDSKYGEVQTDSKGRAQYTEQQNEINKVIQNNAKSLLGLMDSYTRVSKLIESKAPKLSKEAFNEIIYQTLLSDYAKSLQSEAEQKLTGRTKVSDTTAISSLKTSAAESQIQEINSTISELEKKIEVYKNKDTRKKVRGKSGTRIDNINAISKYVQKKTINEAQRRIAELKEYREELQNQINKNNSHVLTKEDIMNLSPTERYSVISNPRNYAGKNIDNSFSQEEKDLIEYAASIDASISKSNDFLKIMNDKHYVELLNYNNLLSTQVEGLESLKRMYQNANTANKFKKKLLKNPYKVLKEHGDVITEGVINVLSKDEQIQKNAKAKEALKLYKEKVEYEKEVAGAINQAKGVPLSVKHLIANSLYIASKGVTNKKQLEARIIDWLEDNITDVNVDESIREASKIILDNLNDIKKATDTNITLQEMSSAYEHSQAVSSTSGTSETSSSNQEGEVSSDNMYLASSKNVEEGLVSSPTLDTKIENSDKEGVKVTEDSLIPEAEVKQEVASETGDIIGNVSSAYNPNDLTVTEDNPVKRLNPRTTKAKGDSYESFMTWAQENSFEYQKVVDNVLGNINAKYHPKVYYMRPFKTGDNNADNTLALVIELTDDIRNDNSITIPGKTLKAWDTISGTEKEYIVIGQAGYTGDAANFNNAKNNAPYSVYSDVNNTNTYYINSSSYTRVQSITSGVVANARGTDHKVNRSINDLLNDPSANPNHLNWNDLVFGFATRTGMTLIGNRTLIRDHQFYHPEISDSPTHLSGVGLGNVFVYIPSANGNYIPIYIPFKRFGEINTTSKLYSDIETLVDELLNGDSQTKRAASAELSKILYTSQESNQYIGVNNEGNFYIRSNAYRVEEVKKPTKNEVLNILKRFYINYNSVAFNKDHFNLLNDAGAFDVDIISLSSYNAQFKMYNTQEQADNFDKVTENNTEPEQKIEGKVKNITYVEVAGIKYSKVGDSWVYTDSGNRVTNTSFTDQLDAYTKAVARGVTSLFGNKVVYVTEDGKYMYQDTDGKIHTITMSVETIVEEEIDSRRDKAATEEIQIQETVETSLEESQPEIPNTTEEIQKNLNEVFGEQQEESKEIIEEEPKKVDNNLDNSEIINSFAKELDSREDTLFELGDILEGKGLVSGDYSSNDVAKVLVNMGISIENLDSINTVKDIIKNCR